jgi:hypothetical protein
VEDRYQCEAEKPRIYIYIYPVLIVSNPAGLCLINVYIPDAYQDGDQDSRRVVAAFWIFLCPEV